MKLAVLTGGPSRERGISLNSARSILDHLGSSTVSVVPVYFSTAKKPYALKPSQLYSNTPKDFDHLLAKKAPLTTAQLVRLLKSCAITFPAMHGEFGEDGDIQAFLERHNIPFVGSPAAACTQCFDKALASEKLREFGFPAVPSVLLTASRAARTITAFFKKHGAIRAIVKPAVSGSSIGVYSVGSAADALAKAHHLFSEGFARLVLEPFIIGREFTVIIVQNRFGLPVALIPTEIEADYAEHQIFDYRKKYLPTRAVTYHCPPRFSRDTIAHIRREAEQLFSAFGMRDFARFDGWVTESGDVLFTDFNPISGMEQNSFLFQQAARCGFSHRGILSHIVSQALTRTGHTLPTLKATTKHKKPIAVLMGGETSERQVSLMSGTNVWLKLLKSNRYLPVPFVMENEDSVWRAPYALLLNHTVEEVIENLRSAPENADRLSALASAIAGELKSPYRDDTFFVPQRTTLATALKEFSQVYIALHGGYGEDGTLQKKLASMHKKHNGSAAAASRLCMDKYQTGRALAHLTKEGILTARKESISTAQLHSTLSREATYRNLVERLGTPMIVKPQGDGCSSGIVQLASATDFSRYLDILFAQTPRIPAHTFPGQSGIIEMPSSAPTHLLFETFIATDEIYFTHAGKVAIREKSGWVEITCGVLGDPVTALPPSITVAEGAVLSVEEKFQGGTGVNLTPPPATILSKRILALARGRITLAARALGIRGYARLDAFVERSTGNVMIIEANTLPALTPSTVLFHQGLALPKPLPPTELLEKIAEI